MSQKKFKALLEDEVVGTQLEPENSDTGIGTFEGPAADDVPGAD